MTRKDLQIASITLLTVLPEIDKCERNEIRFTHVLRLQQLDLCLQNR